jgi:hypothetical protein
VGVKREVPGVLRPDDMKMPTIRREQVLGVETLG